MSGIAKLYQLINKNDFELRKKAYSKKNWFTNFTKTKTSMSHLKSTPVVTIYFDKNKAQNWNTLS